MEYIIVPMDRGHIPQIAALERECFSTPWSENMLSDALFDPKASFIVAEDGEGGVLGYAGLQVVLDEGYIDNIAVEEAARRHGVGDAWPSSPWRCGRATPPPSPCTASMAFRRRAAGKTTTSSPGRTPSS